MPRYLVWFSHHNLYFNLRFHELESLADMIGIDKKTLYSYYKSKDATISNVVQKPKYPPKEQEIINANTSKTPDPQKNTSRDELSVATGGQEKKRKLDPSLVDKSEHGSLSSQVAIQDDVEMVDGSGDSTNIINANGIASSSKILQEQFGAKVDVEVPEHYPTSLNEEPYIYVYLPNQEAVDFIMSRSVLIKFVIEVWAEGSDHDEVVERLVSQPGSDVTDGEFAITVRNSVLTANENSTHVLNLNPHLLNCTLAKRKQCFSPDLSMCLKIFGFGCTLTQEYKSEKIGYYADLLTRSDMRTVKEIPAPKNREEKDAFGVNGQAKDSTSNVTTESKSSIKPTFVHNGAEYLAIKKIDIKNPDTTLLLLEDYGVEDFTCHSLETCNDKKLKKVFVGRQVACAGRTPVVKANSNTRKNDNKPGTSTLGNYWDKYTLAQRAILGPTTMDNELAFLMANLGQSDVNKLVMDPFCGTGGILIALAHFASGAGSNCEADSTNTNSAVTKKKQNGIVYGNDIDIRVLKGWRIAYQKNKKECLRVEKLRGLIPSKSESQMTIANGAAHAASSESEKDDVPDKTPRDSNGDVKMKEESKADLNNPSKSQTRKEHRQQLNKEKNKKKKAAQNSNSGGNASQMTNCKDIYMNFYQYGLKLPEILVLDNANSPWKNASAPRTDSKKKTTPWLNAIVTDPPYGIRAASKKVENSTALGEDGVQNRATYIPQKNEYTGDEILLDLLNFASDNLVDNGRLVFLLPVDLMVNMIVILS